MTDIANLRSFLIEAAAAGYAADNPQNQHKEEDGSTTITYPKGDWKFHDNFFGGEPYGGREVVFFQGQPLWMMVYYGWVDQSVQDFPQIYTVLREALKRPLESLPIRGP